MRSAWSGARGELGGIPVAMGCDKARFKMAKSATKCHELVGSFTTVKMVDISRTSSWGLFHEPLVNSHITMERSTAFNG